MSIPSSNYSMEGSSQLPPIQHDPTSKGPSDEANQLDLKTVSCTSVKSGKAIKPKQRMPKSSSFSIKTPSFIKNIAADIRDGLNLGNGSKLKSDPKYPQNINQLIKQSKPSLNASLKTKRAAGEFRMQLADQLQKLESNGELGNATVKDVLRGMEDSLVLGDGSVTGFLDSLVEIACRCDKDSKTELYNDIASFYNELPARNQERMETCGPSLAPREASRTPMDVMTNLVAELTLASKENPEDKQISQALNKAKAALLTHSLKTDQVKDLLTEIGKKLDSHPVLQELCEKLSNDLPKDGQSLAPTQLFENIYGRALDSAFVGHLVETPPPSVVQAMNQSSQALADHLESLNANQQRHIGEEIQHKLGEEGDPRFWFPQADISSIRDAATPEDAFKALITTLRNDCTNGPQVIARPYLMVKISLALVDARTAIDDIEEPEHMTPQPDWTPEQLNAWDKECKDIKIRNDAKMWKITVPWMDKANANYASHISPRKNLASGQGFKPEQKKDRVGGITLQHQRPLIAADWMEPTTRPLTQNRADFKNLESDKSAHLPLQVATEHGLTWVSGVSGSTNILLHQLAYFKEQGIDIDTNSYLLGALMFLVYDGGHSMQEVLYVANQLNDALDLELDIASQMGGTKDAGPEKFVADYSKFAKSLPKEGASAMDQAVEGLVDYFHENSYYSSTQQ